MTHKYGSSLPFMLALCLRRLDTDAKYTFAYIRDTQAVGINYVGHDVNVSVSTNFYRTRA